MTKGELLDLVLDKVPGAVGYRKRASTYLDNGLRDLEKKASWGFLYNNGVVTFDSGAATILFSASKWGAAGASALTNYSKDMRIKDSNGKPLKRFRDTPGMPAEEAYDESVGMGQSAANPPTHFLCIDGQPAGEVRLHPTPTTTPGTGTYSYRGTIILPVDDTDDLATVSFLPLKFQAMLENYILSDLYQALGFQDKAGQHRQLWEAEKQAAFAEEFPGLVQSAQGV